MLAGGLAPNTMPMLLRINFIITGCILIAAAIFAEGLYDWGTRLLVKWKWTSLAGMRERLRPVALPVARVLLALMGAANIAAGFLL